LNRKVAAARFARTYAQLLRAGIVVPHALALAGGATGNRIAEQVILNARRKVEAGEPLSAALAAQRVFPISMVQMIETGEKSGKVDDMMTSAAVFFEKEVKTMLNGLTFLLLPFFLLLAAIAVGLVVLGILVPLFQLPGLMSM
jgi:type IV pilus assembly protein PilC